MEMRATKNALGWDMNFATNYLGPFALSEVLAPHFPTAPTSSPPQKILSASPLVESRRLPGLSLYFSGSARGERRPGGSKMPGADAYATATAVEPSASDPNKSTIDAPMTKFETVGEDLTIKPNNAAGSGTHRIGSASSCGGSTSPADFHRAAESIILITLSAQVGP